MNFDHAPESKTLLKALCAALDERLAGLDLEAGLDRDAAGARLRAALGALAETGYLDLPTDAAGGPALTAAMEAVASRSTSLLLAVESSTRLFGRAVERFGRDGGRARWLEPLRRGELVGALGLSEATVNVVNDPLTTAGVRDGGEVIVTGVKSLVVNAPVADWIALVGLLDEQAAVFVIPAGASGLTVGEAEPIAAYGGALLAEVTAEGCRIPADHALGPHPTDEVIAAVRGWEDQILIGAALGQMKLAIDAARAHAKRHKTAKGKPIIAFQEVSFQLAEMLTLHQTAQLLAARAAWAAEVGDRDAPMLTDCAKVFCTENAERVTSSALQLLSSEGLRAEHPVARAFHAAKAGRVLGTSNELGRVRLGDDALRRWG